VGKELGYGGIISHGVLGYNKIAHEIVRRLGNGDPSSMLKISARFAGPVRPGDTLAVHLWKQDLEVDGLEEVQWSAQVTGTGQECLCDGTAVIKPPQISSNI
jgi:acyl dehydratase